MIDDDMSTGRSLILDQLIEMIMGPCESELLALLFLLRLVVRFQLKIEGVVENELRQRSVSPQTLAVDLGLLNQVILTLVDESAI